MSLLILASLCQAQELTFVVVGDMQTDGNHSSINWNVFPQMVQDMNAHDPQLGLFVGDLVGGASTVSGTQAQWLDFKSVVADFTAKSWRCPAITMSTEAQAPSGPGGRPSLGFPPTTIRLARKGSATFGTRGPCAWSV